MVRSRNVGAQGLAYRGGGPMWSWMLHRVSGLGMIVFVGLHVVSAFFVLRGGNDAAAAINSVFEAWPFQIFIYFCVIFHALNGLRVIIMDLWPGLMRFQHEAIWLQWLAFIPIYSLTVLLMILRGLGGE
jgi:succinate dehydrogenase / fumarate reductase cytochrome b subunit